MNVQGKRASAAGCIGLGAPRGLAGPLECGRRYRYRVAFRSALISSVVVREARYSGAGPYLEGQVKIGNPAAQGSPQTRAVCLGPKEPNFIIFVHTKIPIRKGYT